MNEHERIPGAPVPEESTVTAAQTATAPPPPPMPEGPEATPAEPSGSEQAWKDVVSSLDDLGAAVTAWARSMTDTPQNRKRVTQLKEGIDSVGAQIGDVVETATKSDVGRELGSAAVAAGGLLIDTARRVGDEVGPHLAGAFKSAAEGLRQAAEQMERRAHDAREAAEEAEPATHPGPSPKQAPYTGEEPPAPAPSGIEGDYVP